MSRIEPRPGLEVFVNKSGTISIARIDESFPQEAPIIVVHPDDVPKLIKLLKQARAEAAIIEAEAEPEPKADDAPPGAPANLDVN